MEDNAQQAQVILKRLQRQNEMMLKQSQMRGRPSLQQNLEEQKALLDMLDTKFQKAKLG